MALKEEAKAEEIRELASRLHRLHDEVSDLVMEAVARYSPVATDLRFLKSALFISYDLYRIARYAFDVASVSEKLGGGCWSKRVDAVGGVVKEMVAKAVDMFLSRDISALEEVERLDDEVVDKSYEEALLDALKGSASTASFTPSLSLCVISSSAMSSNLLMEASTHVFKNCFHMSHAEVGLLYVLVHGELLRLALEDDPPAFNYICIVAYLQCPLSIPAGRGGLSGPVSLWLPGPGLRPVGASGPLLSYVHKRLARAVAAEPGLPLGPAGARFPK